MQHFSTKHCSIYRFIEHIKVFLERHAKVVYLLGGVKADIAVVPRFVDDAGNIAAAVRIAQDEAVLP